MNGFWTRVIIDEGRCFVYGPGLGRLYLLTTEQIDDECLKKLLGLKGYNFRKDLDDPAMRIVYDLSSLKEMPSVRASLFLRIGYRFLHISRLFFPFPMMMRVMAKLAKLNSNEVPFTIPDIGRLIHGIEQAIGFSDCYPRALMTGYLCLKNGIHCDLVVGALTPTRQMHAWCSADGQIPYESFPEHCWYRPLLMISFTP